MRPSSSSFDVHDPQPSIRSAVLVVLTALSTTIACGCGGDQATMPGGESNRVTQVGAALPDPATPAEQPADQTKAPGEPARSVRKIIYDARIELVVDSLNATESAILRLIKENEGFLAESDQTSVTQNQRQATWRVRVPVTHFEKFTSAVARLGEVRKNHVGSQDVTEQFVDLEARIRNKREEEKRLLKHLADSTGKLEDILAVEREITRVRGEAEQMEGKLRFLADRSELSTITIEANEWKDYKPPVAATFQTQMGRTFMRSVEALFEFGKAIALVLIALAPWIPLIVIWLFVMRWLIRHNRSGPRSKPLVNTAPPRAAS